MAIKDKKPKEKIDYLSKITHINCTEQFLQNKENVDLLTKMVKKAYHKKIK